MQKMTPFGIGAAGFMMMMMIIIIIYNPLT